MKGMGKLLVGSLLCCVCISQQSAPINSDYTADFQDTAVCVSSVNVDIDLKTRAKSAFLMDYGTNTVMYSHNETERLPIASMCKIMTLLLCFDAIDKGDFNFSETVCVSERAASMGGSQVFLEVNGKYLVNELIKSIVVCSANDSCVAMAEKIAGNESLFVDKMNEKAKEIGATNTLFSNCTGLPKEPQYSCAKDVAIMLKNLLKHEKYYEFSNVWLDKFAHPEGRYTEITNTNKLVRFYDGCDAGKTGFTNEAGFCLAATAKRDNLRVISVVIGEENSENRFQDVRTMFDYAFANYTATPVLEKEKTIEDRVCVDGGKEKVLTVYPKRSIYALVKRGEKSNVSYSIHQAKAKAPIEKDECIGEAILYQDGVEIDRIELLAAQAIERATLFDRLREIARSWRI